MWSESNFTLLNWFEHSTQDCLLQGLADRMDGWAGKQPDRSRNESLQGHQARSYGPIAVSLSAQILPTDKEIDRHTEIKTNTHADKSTDQQQEKKRVHCVDRTRREPALFPRPRPTNHRLRRREREHAPLEPLCSSFRFFSRPFPFPLSSFLFSLFHPSSHPLHPSLPSSPHLACTYHSPCSV